MLYPNVCKLRPCSVSIHHHSRVTGELTPSPWRLSIEVQVGIFFTELLQSEREQNVTNFWRGCNISHTHTLHHMLQLASAQQTDLLTRKWKQEWKLKLSCRIYGWGECNMQTNFNALHVFCCSKPLPVVFVYDKHISQLHHSSF